MSKRGYKLQEFLAHSGNVNCLTIGKKTSRLLLTGGDDYKVNLWAIDKPTSLMSLCGHTSPVDSVAFNSAEVLVLAGASSGVIKLWDLEEAKMVRPFTGHRSNCSTVEFHPFGQYLASGSSDTDLKVWDIRKKRCIQTYKGHTRGISTINFSPDGRWVVSGGLDNVVKVWDLTAGKLLHEFKFHEGPIRSVDFHPLEFLLATGSADRTVKFWDLETFELIGSTRPEDTGVRSITFHPDGRTLFCGLDDGLKVYSWEPVICHDGVDMGWSTLGDMCINEEKFIGCSYYRNSVATWVSDISLLEPYGAGSEDKNESMVKRFSVLDDQSSERVGSGSRGSSSPDYETKQIKNIYVDSVGQKGTSTLEQGKVTNMASEKQNATYIGQAGDMSSRIHSVISRDSDSGEESSTSRKSSVSFSRTKSGMLLRPAHVRKTLAKFEDSKRSVGELGTGKSGSDAEEEAQRGSKSLDAEDSTIKNIMYKFEKALSSEPSTDEANRMLNRPPRVLKSSNSKYMESRRGMSVDSDSGTFVDNKGEVEYSGDIDLPSKNLCKLDNNNKNISSRNEGVLSPEKHADEQKIVSGRTRSLVEKFERGEKVTQTEAATITTITQNTRQEESRKTSKQTSETPVISTRRARSTPARVMPIVLSRDSNMTSKDRSLTSTQPARTSSAPMVPEILNQATNITYGEPSVASSQQSRTSPARISPVTVNQDMNIAPDEASVTSRRPRKVSSASVRPMSLGQQMDTTCNECPVTSTRPARTSPARVMPTNRNHSDNMTCDVPRIASRHRVSSTQMLATPTAIDELVDMTSNETHVAQTQLACESLTQLPCKKEEPQISGRQNDSDIGENLMQTHNEFLNTLQSRLTKLQIVRHFWERSDVKGAIGALRKMTDQSVQADVISILTDKVESLTLDVFSQLLPVLTSLLGSRMERPVNVSLEMLVKLVAVFGTTIRSTVSAPRIVGVDLHADERLQICQTCSAGLHKIQRILPVLSRRGGLITRKAQELNMILQEP